MTLETLSQYEVLDCKGMFTMPNALSKAPLGSLITAKNVQIDYAGLLTGRRGITQYGTQLIDGTAITTDIFQLFNYKNVILAWFGSNVAGVFDHKLAYDTNGKGTFSTSSTGFSGPSFTLNNKYRTAQGNSNFYITSSTGVLKLDNPSTSLYSAGGLPGLDGVASLTGGSGFMVDNSQVAYRMIWVFTDANNNAISGTPSTRLVVSNSLGHTSNVSLTYTIPLGTTTAFQYQIYRTIASSSATDDPGDQEQLVISGNPNNTDISNGFFTVIDSTPEESLGAFLYTDANLATNPGENSPNNIPPVSWDICFYKQYMLYAGDVTVQQTFSFSLLATDAPNGIQSGDTLTVTRGVTRFHVTGGAAENTATGVFKVFTAGTPAENILDTKNSLIRVINRYTSNTLVYAFDAADVSGIASLPGDLFLQEKGIGRGQLTINSSRATCWKPALQPQITFSVTTVTDSMHLVVSSTTGITAGDTIVQGSNHTTVTTVTDGTHLVVGSTSGWTTTTAYDADSLTDSYSTSGSLGNQVYVSKFGQSEAVPLTNVISVGSPNYPTYRILPLRNAVVVFKQDGIFTLTGETFPFVVTTLDPSCILTAPESPAVLSNQVFCYSNQGVIAVSEVGPGIVSRPIENILQSFASFNYPGFANVTFGRAYETDRKYIMATLLDNTDSETAQQCFVYDTITQTWSQYFYPVQLWDIMENITDHRLYFAPSAVNTSVSFNDKISYVFQERKAFDPSDGADIQFTAQISAFNGTTVTVTSTTAATVGWSLAQLSTGLPVSILNSSKIMSITDSTHLVVEDALSWTTGTGVGFITVYAQPISIEAAYTPIHCNTPNIVKFFMEAQFFFQSINFTKIDVAIGSDFSGASTTVELDSHDYFTGWGQLPWGQGPWGGGTLVAQTIRTYIPLLARRAHWLNITVSLSEAFTTFVLGGFTLTERPVTTRSK